MSSLEGERTHYAQDDRGLMSFLTDARSITKLSIYIPFASLSRFPHLNKDASL